jgi:hypothetical protein
MDIKKRKKERSTIGILAVGKKLKFLKLIPIRFKIPHPRSS